MRTLAGTVSSMADDEENAGRPSTDSADDDLESRLAAFDERVKKAGSVRMPDPPDWNYKRSAKKQITPGADHRGLGIGMTAAYILVGGMFVGWLAGFGVDHLAHSAPTGQAIGGFLGAAFGVGYVIVLANRAAK
ncbi:MAG: AtpZ/AtpI family protein [Fimbriimonadaceae bacterium]